MEILKKTEYIANVEVTDFLTGIKGIVSLKAEVLTTDTGSIIQGYICGLKYKDLEDTLNPEVKQAYDTFMAEIATQI